jgi:Tfp pilus assembly protein PilF
MPLQIARRYFAALLLLGFSFSASPRALAQGTAHDSVAAARLNNTGVALMNQQFLEKAQQKFDEAHKLDPTSSVPILNSGIALLYLRKLPEAEQALKQAAAIDPSNVRIWYSLGLVHFTSDAPIPAAEDFKHAIQLKPEDADCHYYLGTLYLNLKQYDHAIEEFETALRLQPLHASAQFGLAGALQRSGKTADAREHLKRFQQITQTKIGTPFAVTYGEQGHDATVEDMLAPEEPVGPMIPVRFVAQSAPAVSAVKDEAGGGACILDVNGGGEKDIVVMGTGDAAIQVYKPLPNGTLEQITAEKTGLEASGQGIACAVGDYDNDGLPDLAVALSDRIILFHNLGHGKFADTTKATGIGQLNHPAGLTFIDFDHDGDLDLFVTGSPLAAGKGPSILWRNNGDSTFTEWTRPTGLSGSENTTGATLSDINNDRAVDLVVTGAASTPTIYENLREGPFRPIPLYADTGLAPTRGVYVFDFNKDGWMDVAVTHAGGSQPLAQCGRHSLRACPAAHQRRHLRMGINRDRHRQRRLDRFGRNCRDSEWSSASHLAQPRSTGL